MRSASLRACALLALPLTLLACDSGDSSGDDPEIGGTYTGTLQDSGGTIDVTFEIEDTDGGEFDFEFTSMFDGEILGDISGTGEYDFPDVSFTADDGSGPETLEGTVSDDGDRITVEVEPDEALVLRRDD